MPIFRDKAELLAYAENFTKVRLDSLQKDVNHCLKYPYAPFPALLYCFSTIDLLGALYRGNATKDANTSLQSADYMKDFLRYTDEQARLLQKIFRHKIVHLAQPKPIIEDDSRMVAWHYYHDNKTEHLKLKKLQKPVKYTVTGSWTMFYDYEFGVSIKHIVDDIRQSLEDTSKGYLESLSRNSSLQSLFRKAIEEILNPIQM